MILPASGRGKWGPINGTIRRRNRFVLSCTGWLSARSLLSTAVVTAVLTSLFWIAAYSIALPADGSGAPPAASPADRAAAAAGRGQYRPLGSGDSCRRHPPRAALGHFHPGALRGGRPHDAIDIMRRRGRRWWRPRAARSRSSSSAMAAAASTAVCPLARPAMDLLLTRISRTMRRACTRAQRLARGDPIGTVGSTRQRQSGRTAPPFRHPPHGPDERLVAGEGDQSLTAAAGQRRNTREGGA
jgi:hypothetical protein